MSTLTIIKIGCILGFLSATSIAYATGKSYNINFENKTQNIYTININNSSHIADSNIDAIGKLTLNPMATTQFYELHTNGPGTANEGDLTFTLNCRANDTACGSSTCTFAGVIVRHSFSMSCSQPSMSNANWSALVTRDSDNNATISLVDK